MRDDLDERRKEFNRNVWNHADDPFQMQFDERPPLAPSEIATFARIVQTSLSEEVEAASKSLRRVLADNPDLLAIVLQLVGLTRNKILQDLKAAQRNGIFQASVPSSFKGLPRSNAWSVAGPYLVERIRRVFLTLKGKSEETVRDAVEVANQATWPGYIRQERAKRQGHEAEFRIAALHLACELKFQPEEKATNPLCRDAMLGTVSFDLVVPNVTKPRLVVKSTVHTSNIGQYGESKDHLEVDEARRYLDENFEPSVRPVLLAFIDGVGFESNRAGLDGVLSKTDEFCQFKTIWKSIFITAQIERRSFRVLLPEASIKAHSKFLSRWPGPTVVSTLDESALSGDEVPAGEGYILVN